MGFRSGKISPTCRIRLHTQGYGAYTDAELAGFRFGIRFAYGLCATLFATGVIFGSPVMLIIAASFALLGTLPPYHPFDYLYNYVVRHWIGRPKLPPRPNQGRFACGIAAVWVSITIYLLLNNDLVAVYIMSAVLLTVAFLVTVLDYCIPSMIYNFFFVKRQNR